MPQPYSWERCDVTYTAPAGWARWIESVDRLSPVNLTPATGPADITLYWASAGDPALLPNWVAYTYRWWVGARLTSARVGVRFTPYSKPTLRHLVKHELLHALGFDHAGDPTSVMHPEAAATPLSPADRAAVRASRC